MSINFSEYIGKTVSFSVYPAQLLTDSFTNVIIAAVATSDAARSFIDAPRLHVEVFPTLPEGTPNGYQLYDYLLIKKPDNTITAIGVPWVREETLSVVSSTELVASIRGMNVSDIPRIKQILAENGIMDIQIDVKA